MANWAYALSKGAEAGLASGTGMLTEARKKEETIEAEIRAANTQLDLHSRKAAADEMFKTRAAERFSAIMRNKAGEQVPLEAEAVTKLGQESAQAIGLQDGMQGDQRQMNAQFQDVLNDPKASQEQKQQAQEILDQIGAQGKAQGLINSDAAEGKTRNRTTREAARAAMEESMMNDPAAYMAGKAMLATDDKGELEERKIASREKLEQMRIEQRDRSDDKRFESMMARIESGFGGKGSGPTALMQNAEYLKTLGYSSDKIEKFIFEKKEVPLEDLAAKILSNSKDGMGDPITPSVAASRAIALRDALNKKPAPSADPGGENRPALSTFKK